MECIIRFWKSTAWISRIFFFLWIYIAAVSNYQDMSRLEIVFESALYFLTPAMVVELIRNSFKKTSDCIGKSESEYREKLIQAEQSKEEPYLIIHQIAMIFFGVLAFIGMIGIVGFGSDSTEVLPPTLLCAMLSFACGFFYLNAPKTKAEAEAKEKAQATKRKEQRMREKPLQLNNSKDSEREISEQDIEQYLRKVKIMSVVFVGILVVGGILAVWVDNIYVAVSIGLCAVIAAIYVLTSVYDSKIKAKIKERQKAEDAQRAEQRKHEKWLKSLKTYKGVYLTGEQIYQTENKIVLPRINTPMFLEYDEVAVYHSVAIRQVMEKQVVGRSGGYSGGTVRVTKRFSIHMGSSSGIPVYGEVPVNYEGDLIITNKRLVFWSSQNGFSVPHNRVLNVTPCADGFWFIGEKDTYTLLVPKAELAISVLSAVRDGTIPIDGCEAENQDVIQVKNDICKEESNDTLQENTSEIEKNDISSIDGMNGHEFEYFCADLLRKNGFSEVNVTKGSGDQGVDILAVKDGIKYAIQCKNYATALSNTPIQEVNAGKTFYNCHVGVVMTNSTFTQGAEALAQATGVLLWNREAVKKMMEATE